MVTAHYFGLCQTYSHRPRSTAPGLPEAAPLHRVAAASTGDLRFDLQHSRFPSCYKHIVVAILSTFVHVELLVLKTLCSSMRGSYNNPQFFNVPTPSWLATSLARVHPSQLRGRKNEDCVYAITCPLGAESRCNRGQ